MYNKFAWLKFGQKSISSKDFHKQRLETDIVTTNVNKFVLSDGMWCNNGKGWWYIVEYQEDAENNTPLFINTSKNIFSYGVSQYKKITQPI